MTLLPGDYGHWQKYLLDRRKICMNCEVHCYDVINKCNCKIITARSYWEESSILLSNATRIACPLVDRGRGNTGKIASWWKWKAPESTCTTCLCTVVITLLHLHYL